jgi:hypothetical protein
MERLEEVIRNQLEASGCTETFLKAVSAYAAMRHTEAFAEIVKRLASIDLELANINDNLSDIDVTLMTIAGNEENA